MTSFHDELKCRRLQFLNDCRLCRWGSLAACDRALAYSHLGISDRWDLLRQRQRIERWCPFRDRGADLAHRPPLPDCPDVSPDVLSDKSSRLASRLNPYLVAGTVGAAVGAVIWVAFGERLGF